MSGVPDLYAYLKQVERMPEKDFWALIEKSHHIQTKEKLPQDEALGQLLVMMSTEKIASYFKTFQALSKQLNNDQVYAVLGGSDDGFTDGRSWAISKGKDFYYKLWRTPETMRNTKTKEFEVFAYVPMYAAEQGKNRELYLQAGRARVERVVLEKIPEGCEVSISRKVRV